MKTLLDIINLGEDFLRKKGIDRARREAEELIADVLGMSRIALYLDFEKPLSEKELDKCRQYFKRRGEREPLQYISGKIPFLNLQVKVNPYVLIPRPETEQLVHLVIRDLETRDLEGKTLFDMCTGSGCIGISLKKRFPQLRVILSDVSQEALAVAQENAKENGVDVEIRQGNMFEVLDHSIDYFISNPPYVSENDYQNLEPEIKFEPTLAFLGGIDGLSFYRQIAKKLPQYLKETAWLEIGFNQRESLLEIFENNSFQSCSFEKDWSGKDRFLKLI